MFCKYCQSEITGYTPPGWPTEIHRPLVQYSNPAIYNYYCNKCELTIRSQGDKLWYEKDGERMKDE